MKKFVGLLILLLSLVVLSCSDSSGEYVSGIVGYEAFVAAKNAWKEPAGYSFTAEIFTNAIGPRSIDVKVENGMTVLSYTPNRYNPSRSPEEDLLYFPFDIKTIAGLFESIEKENVYITTDPLVRNTYDCCLIGINYGKYNDITIPTYVHRWGQLKGGDRLDGGNSPSLTITDFKILEE